MRVIDGAFEAALAANINLTGDALAVAARQLAQVADKNGAALHPIDAIGERVAGAASALEPNRCRFVDPTARLDGMTVMLVSGAVATPLGIVEAVALAHSVGASHVHVAVLGCMTERLAGVESITYLRTPAFDLHVRKRPRLVRHKQ